MAVYKIPQDVEADDKLIGPFSFKQFVMIIVSLVLFWLTWTFWRISPIMAIFPLPFAMVIGALGVWPRRKQPIEVYLSAMIHYWTQPRKRIWRQEGHVDHVKITAPKTNAEQVQRRDLTTNEVSSNLKRLAQTMDTRGWSVKNIEVRDVAYNAPHITNSDRIAMPVAATSYKTPDQPIDIHQRDDILDTSNNQVAHKFRQLSQKSSSSFKQTAIDHMKQSLDDPTQKKPLPIKPAVDSQQQKHPPKTTDTSHKDHSNLDEDEANPAILRLSKDSNLSISTLAKEAEQVLTDDTTVELR